jgi:hypothetical protein
MLNVDSEVVCNTAVAVALWKHECYRVIADRFTEPVDKDWFEKALMQVNICTLRSYLSSHFVDLGITAPKLNRHYLSHSLSVMICSCARPIVTDWQVISRCFILYSYWSVPCNQHLILWLQGLVGLKLIPAIKEMLRVNDRCFLDGMSVTIHIHWNWARGRHVHIGHNPCILNTSWPLAIYLMVNRCV